ncbi:glu/Leu/Phe/Val dehydrogenase, dimerization domain protein [Paraburkholderia xenovorans LB400]|uniref:Glu/Leu/Phe/Val dehydrogenase n=1 Tax=Paraburkholderia xenovorans (strain LB400) TaxID=266265 RepID=Q140G7_PARXL|nr:Glu/Leu/Phe/Val dehydrogenase dimerization domain-containing protein [Paraburkholderia xenovorans]ABE30272.1 Putative Glu/Leu/Phe/Val dehydrogenase [Paraburkholderia xenovorans LB400]AIP32702.1 glu/Leu/Phe/Val dehydrogenase, dimerization domain protein [Paraburkholderia xenovorans LB400]
MSELFIPTDHQHVQIKPGQRTGLPVMIGVHSTLLGPAIGGLRIKPYARGADAVADVLRLSQAMTVKAAAIDNGTGGGKAVVPLPVGSNLSASLKDAILLDVADQVHALGGIYHVGPDVGSGESDMDAIRRRTPYVGGFSKRAGGAGGTTYGTYIGLDAAIRTAVRQVLNADSLQGLHVSVVGLGGIGTLIARAYAAEGARLTVSDIDETRRPLADEIGAAWVSPEEAMTVRCDVLAPCALGGVLTREIVPRLTARVICGAANNQLATEDIADALRSRETVYVPDFIANAGGLMYASGIELHHARPTHPTPIPVQPW